VDDLGLAVLAAEMGEDARVAAEAARTARERFGSGSPGEAESAGYHLARLYNVVENLAMRVARAFENRLEEDSGWHVELLRRLSIAIPGVRPALLGTTLLEDLQELRGFRHVFRHAYDTALRPERLPDLLEAADRVARELPGCIRDFVQAVADEQGWSPGS
jgi:hypothetical protein